MSFDPHPIDRLALNCLLTEGLALQKLPSPSPSLYPCWRIGISTKNRPKNLLHDSFTIKQAEQGNPALSTLPKLGLGVKPF